MVYDYINDPAEIYRRSFAMIAAETDLSDIPSFLHAPVLRMVHACAMPDIAKHIRWYGNPVYAAQKAFSEKAALIADSRMVVSGLTRGYFSSYPTHCILDEPGLVAEMLTRRMTKSSAGMGLWRNRWKGGIIAIGNAPTALFRMLEELAGGAAKPAAIFAFPIGFIGAAESKEALMQAKLDIPFLTLEGRFGGSALAAAAVNALVIK